MSDLQLISQGSDHVNVEEAWLPYKHLRTLGSGGCSTVDEVRDRLTGQVFARKVVMPRRRAKQRMLEMFHNELKIIRSLAQHHHIIRVFATYTVKETGALAMLLSPVADGGDLDKYLERYSALRRNFGAQAAQVVLMGNVLCKAFGCLAAGLDFIHRNRVRHKDIKTHNILIHGNCVLYADFGLSFDSNLLDNSTTEGPTEMTRKYAAPEVLAGKPRNSSSDVYSLGCVFFEIYAALRPLFYYDETQKFADIMQVVHNQLHIVSPMLDFLHINPSLDTILPMAIREMTVDDPSSRWTAGRVRYGLEDNIQLRCEECGRSDRPFEGGMGGIGGETHPGASGAGGNATRTMVNTEHPSLYPQATHATILSLHLQPAASLSAPRYTPWIWHHPSRHYYCHRRSVDGTKIIDTIWSDGQFSTARLLPPRDRHLELGHGGRHKGNNAGPYIDEDEKEDEKEDKEEDKVGEVGEGEIIERASDRNTISQPVSYNLEPEEKQYLQWLETTRSVFPRSKAKQHFQLLDRSPEVGDLWVGGQAVPSTAGSYHAEPPLPWESSENHCHIK